MWQIRGLVWQAPEKMGAQAEWGGGNAFSAWSGGEYSLHQHRHRGPARSKGKNHKTKTSYQTAGNSAREST